jgi:DNA polymerase I
MSLFGGVEIVGRPDPENVRKLDLLPIPMIRKAQRYGIAIDVPYFHDLTSTLSAQMKGLRDDIACEIPPEKLELFCSMADNEETETRDSNWSPINVESPTQLAKLMFDVLGIGRGKDLKRSGDGSRISTGKKQLEVLKKEHPVVQLILDYRERSKLKNTYTATLPQIAKLHPRGKCCPVCELRHVESTFRVHTEFTTTRAATGRLASKNPNLQNIPARSMLGRMVRAGFIASPGCLLLSRDFSQIELRLLAHAAIEHELIKIFKNRQDPHLMTAMRAFNISDPANVDKLLHRAPCKNVNFGVVYGLAAPGLYDLMAVTYATAGKSLPIEMEFDGVMYRMVESNGDRLKYPWCQAFIDGWFSLYPEVKAYMEDQFYRAKRYKFVWDMFGRIRLVPEVCSILPWIKNAGLRQSGNMPIQSDGAGLMKLAMGETDEVLTDIRESGIWNWPLLSIHDEMIIEVEEDYADSTGEIVGDVMDNVLTDKQSGKRLCRVPILSDGHPMPRWVKE